MLIAVSSGSCLTLSGCATAPTTPEINQAYRDWRAFTDESYETMMAACQSLQGQEKADCEENARQWRIAQYTLINQGYRDALDGEWDSLRERRKQIEEELLEMLPNFPEIRDIFNIQGSMAGNSGLHRQVVGYTDIGDPVPIELTTYNFSGSVGIGRIDQAGAEYVDSASTSGFLELQISFDGLEATGKVRSGTLVASMGNGETATLTVLKDATNRIVTDSQGRGSIVFLANLDHSLPGWDALLMDTQRIYLPVQVVSDTSLLIDSEDSAATTIAPFEPMSHSDYNMDGFLDYNSDFAAFLSDHYIQSPRADINVDGAWDQADIDLWIWDFENDQIRLP